jgi:hypothetical protein
VNKVFYILLFLPILYSCENKKENKKIKEECYNLKYLASIDKNLPEVEFNANFFANLTNDTIRKIFKPHDCERPSYKSKVGCNVIEIGYPFITGNCVEFYEFETFIVYYNSYRNRYYFYSDSKFMSVDIDSLILLSIEFKEFYLKTNKNFKRVFLNYFEEIEDLETTYKVLFALEDGYKKAVSELCLREYSKEICDLTVSEYLALKKKYPFRISFNTKEHRKGPPPPTKH